MFKSPWEKAAKNTASDWLEEMGFWVMMGDHDVNDEGTIEEIWWCEFYPSDENIPKLIRYADTAPEAICLAALKAVEDK